MKLIFAAALLACLVSPVALGQKANKSNDGEFKTLIERYFAAWSSLNPDNAAPLYAKDADLVFYDLAPLKYTGWTEYDKGVRNVLGGFESLKLTPNSDLKVTRRGNVAWTAVQEYFVPVDRFDDFLPKMQAILRRHDANVINVSIRHARQDPGSLLAWARTEVFAFVIYYKQETSDSARSQVGVWTRELIDAALDVGGSYYLPYQLHATEEQFLRAYPRAPEFLALKQRLDPTNKFRSKLLDKYLHPR